MGRACTTNAEFLLDAPALVGVIALHLPQLIGG